MGRIQSGPQLSWDSPRRPRKSRPRPPPPNTHTHHSCPVRDVCAGPSLLPLVHSTVTTPRPRSSAPCGEQSLLGSPIGQELLGFPLAPFTASRRGNSSARDVWATWFCPGAPLRAQAAPLQSAWFRRLGPWRVSSQKKEGPARSLAEGSPHIPHNHCSFPGWPPAWREGIKLEVSECTVCTPRGSAPPKGQPLLRSVPSTRRHHPPRVQLEPRASGF